MSIAGPCATLELTARYCISTFVPRIQLLMVSIFLFFFNENNIFDTLPQEMWIFYIHHID